MTKQKKLPRGIYPGKDGWYWIRYTDQHGQLHREKGSPMLAAAKARLERRRDEVRSGRFFPEKIKQRSALFGELAREYLKLAQGRKRSWRDSEDHLETLLPILKDVPVADLTPGRLESILGDVAEEREWAPATFNRYRSTLSGVFQLALRNCKAQSNPARLIAHRKENNLRVRFLSQDEEAKLIAALRSNWPEREAELIVAIHSGMRRSEQYRTHEVPDGGLKWEHINFRAGVIRLPRSKPGKPKEIPMNSALTEALRSIPQKIDSPYVFDGTDPGKWFGKALRAAKIKDFHWHDLRHTFGSRLAMAGVSMRHIADLMGHSEIQTTMRYAHLQPGHLAEAVERLVDPQPAKNSGTKLTPELTPAVSALSKGALSH